MKVVFTLPVAPEDRAYLKARVPPSVELVFPEDLSEASLVKTCDGAAVVVGARSVEAILEACPSLRLVQVPWAGVESVAEAVRARTGILVANAHRNAYTTAQYAVSMLLCLMNRLVPSHAELRSGGWSDRGRLPLPVNLSGKTAGILGVGHVGRRAAGMLAAFGARVIGLKRTPLPVPPPPFEKLLGPDAVQAFVRQTDALLVTLPATAETRNMIGLAELELLGPSGYLVNVGRGEVVHEEALYVALKEGRIAGAAIDVWYDYHPPPDVQGRSYPYHFPFHELDNILLSPHRAGTAAPAPSDWDEVIENLARFAAGRCDLLNIVDLEAGY